MTDNEIIERVFSKAILNGYHNNLLTLVDWEFDGEFIFFYEENAKKGSPSIAKIHINEIIFDHPFAKAFWKDLDWEFHISKLALAENRIQYLSKFI